MIKEALAVGTSGKSRRDMRRHTIVGVTACSMPPSPPLPPPPRQQTSARGSRPNSFTTKRRSSLAATTVCGGRALEPIPENALAPAPTAPLLAAEVDLEAAERGEASAQAVDECSAGSSLPSTSATPASPVAVVEAQLWTIFSQNEHSSVIEMFKLFDTDSSGVIDIVEFRDALETMGIDAPKSVLDATFASFDADSSGGLEYSELYAVLKKNHIDAAAAAAAAAKVAARRKSLVVGKRTKRVPPPSASFLGTRPHVKPLHVVDVETTPRFIVDAVHRENLLAQRSPSWRQYISDLHVFKMMKAKDRLLPMSEAARSPRHLEDHAMRLSPPTKPKTGPKQPVKKRVIEVAQVAVGVAVVEAPRTICQLLQQLVMDVHRGIVGTWSCLLETDLEIQIIALYMFISAAASAWSTGSRAYAIHRFEEGQAPPAPPAAPNWDVGLQKSLFGFALGQPVPYLFLDFGIAILIGVIVLFWEDIKAWRKARELAQRQREAAKQGYTTLGSKLRDITAMNSVLKNFKGIRKATDGRRGGLKPKASPRTRAKELVDPDDVDSMEPPALQTETDLRRELAREGDKIEELEILCKVHAASPTSTEGLAIRLNLHRERRTYIKQALTAIVGDEEEPSDAASVAASSVVTVHQQKKSGLVQWLLDSGIITVITNSVTGFISCSLFFIDVASDIAVIQLLLKTGNLEWALMAVFFLVAQYVVVFLRVLPYMRNTFGASSCINLSFLYLGFPVGVLLLDVLMLMEPFGLLAVLPLPAWVKEFVPAYKATRVITEIFIESLPQALLQSYILVVMMSKVAAGTDDPHILAMLPGADDLPTSITISTLATLKTWIDIVQQSRAAGISGSITDWKCDYTLSPAEIPPLTDALIKNTSLHRLNLAKAGLEWHAADGNTAPLVEAMRANDGLSGLSLLVVSEASGFENPVGHLRSGPESALAALEGVRFFARGQNRGAWTVDLLMCGEVLRANRNRSIVTDSEREAGEAVAKLLEGAHNGEIDRELWERRTKKLMAGGHLRRSHLKCLINAECLRNVGFRAADLVATGVSLRELKAGRFNVSEMREADVAVSDLSAAKYSPSELHEGGVTAAELKPLGYQPSELREGGFSASDMWTANYPLADLKGVYTASELYAAEYPASEMRKVGFEVVDLRVADWRVDLLRRGGYSATEIRTGGYDATQTHDAGYSATEAAAAGWPLDELKAAGYDASELRKADYAVGAMKAAGFMPKELRKAGYKPTELYGAGFNPEEIRQAGVGIAEIMAAGATIEEMRTSGIAAAALKMENVRLKDLRLGGYTCKDIKAAGYKCKELKAAGFVEGLKAGGYPLEEAVASKYKIDELRVGGYTAEELIGAGFKPLEMRAAGYDASSLQSAGVTLPKLRAAGVSAQDLRNAGFGCHELREVGIDAVELQAAGATAAELKAAAFPLEEFCKHFPVKELRDVEYTCDELRQVGFKAGDVFKAGATERELREGGYSAGEMKKVGIPAGVLKKLMCTATELRQAGFTAKELAAVGFASYDLAKGGYRPRQVKECGFKGLVGFDIEAFKEDGFKVPELRDEEGYSLQQLASCFSVKELRTQGEVSAVELLDVGYTLEEICQGGYNPSELCKAGYGAQAMKKAGFTCSEVREAGFVEGIKEAGYTCKEARAAGYGPDLKRAGFTPLDLKRAGCSFGEAKVAGFVQGLKEAGFSCADAKKERFAPKLLRAAGYTCAEARAGGYAKELRAAGYSPAEARAAGCSCEEAKEAGYIQGLCEAGYTVKECFDANFECIHVRMAGFVEGIKAGGFTQKEAKIAGYSGEELRLAGFTCAEFEGTCSQARAAGYTAAEAKAAGWSWKDIAAAGYSIQAKPKAGVALTAAEVVDLSC